MEKEESTKQFVDSAEADVQRVLQEESATNPHVRYFVDNMQMLATSTGQLSLVEYGVSRISDKEDHDLASFFFALANVSAFPPEVRDFLMDAMVHCEDLHGPLGSAENILDVFAQKIRPALEQGV